MIKTKLIIPIIPIVVLLSGCSLHTTNMFTYGEPIENTKQNHIQRNYII